MRNAEDIMHITAANPSEEHLNHAMYILRYLAGTRNYALVFDGPRNSRIYAYVDSSHGDDKTEPDRKRRSCEGWFFSLAGAAVKWQSKTQENVSTSSTVSEYMAMSNCSKDCAWFKTMLKEIGRPVPFIPLYADSNGAIFNAQNPHTGKGLKHIEIRYHYIHEQVEKGTVKLYRVDTNKNPADMFTKNLGPEKFLHFRSYLGLKFYPLT